MTARRLFQPRSPGFLFFRPGADLRLPCSAWQPAAHSLEDGHYLVSQVGPAELIELPLVVFLGAPPNDRTEALKCVIFGLPEPDF